MFYEFNSSNRSSNLLFEWLSYFETIKTRNKQLNDCTVKLVDRFAQHGYRSCILKGQANSLMYPHPEFRSPGDIDIWIDGKREEIIQRVLKEYPQASYSIHHIKYAICDDVSVEVHYTPVNFENWFVNRKLQKYIESKADNQFSHQVSMGNSKIGSLTDEFNALYFNICIITI